MAKWIYTGSMLLCSVPTLSFAWDDQGPNIFSWIDYQFITAGILISILASYHWFKSFKKTKNAIALLFVLLPVVLTAIHFPIYYKTQAKVNRPYFMLARNPDNHAHQFQYYFRGDGTLKTHGLFFWTTCNDFQNFVMRGDTIFLDTILHATGIQSKVYLKSSETDSSGAPVKLLIPLDKHFQPLDSLTKFIVVEEKTKQP
jgi:hypothetical protein